MEQKNKIHDKLWMTVDVVVKAVEAGEVNEIDGMTFLIKKFNEIKKESNK